MTDHRNTLKKKFEPANRHANFGGLLMRMTIHGFRSHSGSVIEIESPITAFSGVNGVGKSTLLQTAAVAFKRPGELRNYRLSEFLAIGPLDPQPFQADARAEFGYWQSDRSLMRRTVSWNADKTRWRYPRSRPERHVFFAGVGMYLPRVEQRDLIIRNARLLSVGGTTPVGDDAKNAISYVLGYEYLTVDTRDVSYRGRQSKVASVDRAGTEYSEAHMGFGEGRIQYLIRTLETLPNQGLVLIEEPETSLHLSAQQRFGSYLVDVCLRKGHQVLVTTHSEQLLKALPTDSRVYLKRTDSGVVPIVGMTSMEMASLMADGEDPALHVLVEDVCAQAILFELIRGIDLDFLSVIRITAAGGANSIKQTLAGLKSTGLPVAAVLDGDQAAEPQSNRFTLPGTKAPELEMFESGAVAEHVKVTYGLDLGDFRTTLVGVDYHDWIARLARRVQMDQQALTGELARIYCGSLSESYAFALVSQLKQAVEGTS